MIDYQMLRVIWWLILGLVLIGFAVFDGFDLGFGAIFPFIAREEKERQALAETRGAFCYGKQAWLILGMAAALSAWPLLSATGFPAVCFVILILACAFMLRPVGFGLRKRLNSRAWRRPWDWVLCAGGVIPALLCGVAFGNLFLGIPIHIDSLILTPFALLCGTVSLTMMVLHGACYAAANLAEPMAQRARHAGIGAAGLFVMVFIAAGIGVVFSLEGYRILSAIDPFGASDPTLKQVSHSAPGVWLDNYLRWPLMWLAPLAALLGALFACWLLIVGWSRAAFVASCVVPLGTILTAGFALFPFLIPSSEIPNLSLTVWDASSSALTLQYLLVGVVIALPIMLIYTVWAIHTVRVGARLVGGCAASSTNAG
jgi:cytochrome d ubiquinol oxidase subunit II